MIRILHVVSVLDVGGMESYIMNMYRNIDRTKLQFDFLVHHGRRGVFEDEIEALGGKVYHTTVLDDLNIVKYVVFLKNLFKQHPEYRIIHGHLNSLAYLYLGSAKRYGISNRIMHSHLAGRVHSIKGNMKHLLSQLSALNANIRFACSTEAGRYLYKKKTFELIPNGINMDSYIYSEQTRMQMRKRLGVDEKFVIGHIGRFDHQKNHEYLLDVFQEVYKRIPDAVLIMLGDGVLIDRMREKAKAAGIDKAVLFMGLVKEDVPSYYDAMDVFVLPSLFEGLPLVGIEAQMNGLTCLFADTITSEVKFNGNVSFLPIGRENIEKWSQAIEEIYQSKTERAVISPDIAEFDSKVGTEKMVARYMNLWEHR